MTTLLLRSAFDNGSELIQPSAAPRPGTCGPTGRFETSARGERSRGLASLAMNTAATAHAVSTAATSRYPRRERADGSRGTGRAAGPGSTTCSSSSSRVGLILPGRRQVYGADGQSDD